MLSKHMNTHLWHLKVGSICFFNTTTEFQKEEKRRQTLRKPQVQTASDCIFALKISAFS